MAVPAYDVTQVRDYTLISDVGDSPTVFSIGCLDSQLHSFLIDKSRSFGLNTNGQNSPATVNVNIEMQNYDIVQFGLKGWTNFLTKGEEAKFETISKAAPFGRNYNVVSPRCMDFLKPYLTELARAITTANTVTKEDDRSFSLPSIV